MVSTPAGAPRLADSLLVGWDRAALVPAALADPADSVTPFPRSRTLCLGCEGFIANRSELIHSGGLPHSTPDRQLLLHLYQRYGCRAATLVAGPFAWIVWDGDRQELVAARDRMGTHGLYYAVSGDTVVVASRVEPILAKLPRPIAFNPRSIVAQINWQVPLAGESFYEGIHAVEPGAMLTVTRRRTDVSSYWRVESQPTLKLASDEEYADAFRDLLFRVVDEYLPRQPVAVALSGGMDSTTLAAAIRTIAPDVAVTGVTHVAPELPESDEGDPASSVCKHLKAASLTIRSDVHWPLSSPEGIKTRPDTPSYNIFTDLWEVIWRRIRQLGIHVIFTGISGDHLFDYVTAYPDLLLTGRWLELARQIRVHLPHARMSLTKLIRGTLLGPIARAYGPRWLTTPEVPVPWLATRHRDWYHENFGRADRSWRMPLGKQKRVQNLQDPALRYSVEQSNRQAADRHMEFRHPLMDHRLIEFAISVPSPQTYRAGRTKLIMRQAMRGYLPNEILDRRDNTYTSAIIRRGLKEREQTKVWRLMTDMRAAELGFVDEACLRQTYKAYLAGEVRRTDFWHTLTLEDWLRRYF